ncbi:MAG: HAD family hydrolase [Candidatus Sumerlaeia bacterium]|nr:HAD family hydrolase [Candidatus Sumerlaeia bacterium]
MRRIRGVFFDAFRTLVYLHPTYPGAFADVARDFGYPVDEARVAAVLDSIERAMETRWREKGDFRCSPEELNRRWRALNRAIFEAIGIDGDADRLSIEMERRFDSGEYIRTYPDTLPMIEALREEGFRLGVISNGTPGVARCLEFAGITERVEFVLVSALVGWEKPAAEIFAMGLQAVGLQPGEVVFVGDHYEADIVGARQAGMQAVLIDREGRASENDCVKVRNLLEFRQWLQAQTAMP